MNNVDWFNKDSDDDNGDSDLENLDENGNKINNNKIDYHKYQKLKNNKLKEFQDKQEYNVPDSVRILGVFFDPKLSLNEHINKTYDRCNKDIYKLIKIANCKYYKLSAFTIWKLWVSGIRPKIEYALCTVSSASKFKKFEQLQNRVAKLALRVRNITPTIYAKEILNYKSIKQRVEELQIKLWIKYSRAPDYLMQNKTFNDWKNYLINNNSDINNNYLLRNRYINNLDNLIINEKKLYHIKKSPLSRAYKLIYSLYKNKKYIFSHKRRAVMKPPPGYKNPFPSNIKVFDKIDYQPINVTNKNKNATVFYSDGSCMPNPGPGGSAFYSKNFVIKSKIESINHDTTINYAELNSIKLILHHTLQYIKSKINFNKNSIYNKKIIIFTDSQYCCNMFKISGFPKYDYYYQLMDKIINLCNELETLNVKINIYKVRSHTNVRGNEKADKLAKVAARRAKNHKYNFYKFGCTKYYNTALNPPTVDISFLYEKLKKKHRIERKYAWQDEFKKQNNKNSNFFHNSEKLFAQSIINRFNNKLINNNNKMKNELKYLSAIEAETINKLRTEYINLNNFEKKFFKKCDGLCNICGINDTVSHFLLECKINNNENNKINELRHAMINKLKKIDIFYKNDFNINSINLLFPHTWQQDPTRDDKEWKIKMEINTAKRVKILKIIVNFVLKTERFKDLEYGM